MKPYSCGRVSKKITYNVSDEQSWFSCKSLDSRNLTVVSWIHGIMKPSAWYIMDTLSFKEFLHHHSKHDYAFLVSHSTPAYYFKGGKKGK